jgi:hypothetical protein
VWRHEARARYDLQVRIRDADNRGWFVTVPNRLLPVCVESHGRQPATMVLVYRAFHGTPDWD